MNSIHATLANRIVEQFKITTSVETIALGGSNTGGPMDKHSDIDLYIYTKDIIPLDTRQAIVEKMGASKADLNLTFWDLGDEWFDLETVIASHYVNHECTDVKHFVELVENNRSKGSYAPETIVMKIGEEIEIS